MKPKRPAPLRIELDRLEEPWKKIRLKADRKVGTVLLTFDGRVSILLDASAALDLSGDLQKAAFESCTDPQPRKPRLLKQKKP